jgi:hypothetical protein
LDDDDDDITVIGGDDEAVSTPEQRGDFLTPPEGAAVAAEAPAPAGEAVSAERDEDESIPKARFDQERVRRLMAEAELQRLQEAVTARQQETAAVPTAPELSVEELDRAAWDAAMEGDETRAAALRSQMLQQLERRAVQAAEAVLERRSAESELKAAVAEVRAAYPQLDTDAELTQEVVAYRDFLYTRNGMPLADALRKAAKMLAGAPVQTAEAAPALGAKPDPAADRKRAAVERAAQASRQQPVAAAAMGVGMRAHEAPTRDIEQMSEDEFAALSPAELRRLRGDAG